MAQATAERQSNIGIPNDLEPFWMPFTANRAFKARPRLIAGAKDMYYITPEGRKVIDASAERGSVTTPARCVTLERSCETVAMRSFELSRAASCCRPSS